MFLEENFFSHKNKLFHRKPLSLLDKRERPLGYIIHSIYKLLREETRQQKQQQDLKMNKNWKLVQF